MVLGAEATSSLNSSPVRQVGHYNTAGKPKGLKMRDSEPNVVVGSGWSYKTQKLLQARGNKRPVLPKGRVVPPVLGSPRFWFVLGVYIRELFAEAVALGGGNSSLNFLY